jgi:hypothetical protein
MARQRTLGTRVVDAVHAKLLRAVDLVVGQTYQDERAPEGAPAEGHEREDK